MPPASRPPSPPAPVRPRKIGEPSRQPATDLFVAVGTPVLGFTVAPGGCPMSRLPDFAFLGRSGDPEPGVDPIPCPLRPSLSEGATHARSTRNRPARCRSSPVPAGPAPLPAGLKRRPLPLVPAEQCPPQGVPAGSTTWRWKGRLAVSPSSQPESVLGRRRPRPTLFPAEWPREPPRENPDGPLLRNVLRVGLLRPANASPLGKRPP